MDGRPHRSSMEEEGSDPDSTRSRPKVDPEAEALSIADLRRRLQGEVEG